MPYVIGGRSVQLQHEPQNLNGPVYVPLREVMEQIGGSASWDHGSKTAGATYNGRHARLPENSTTMDVDGRSVGMSVPIFMQDNQVWVPIEFFEKAFGVVAIADASNTVTVNV
jgi:hypothetical protein